MKTTGKQIKADKKSLNINTSKQHSEIKTDIPLSEKDEVKQAEANLARPKIHR